MSYPSTIRRLPIACLATLALSLALTSAGCRNGAVSPLPAEAAPPTTGTPTAMPGSTPSGTPSRATQPANAPPRPVHPKPTKTHTPKPTTPPSCYGPVLVDIDVQNTVLELLSSMCFQAGGVLRLHSIGPGLVTVEPAGLTSTNYEAAVYDIRFLRPGTVTVSFPENDKTYTVTVVIIR